MQISCKRSHVWQGVWPCKRGSFLHKFQNMLNLPQNLPMHSCRKCNLQNTCGFPNSYNCFPPWILIWAFSLFNIFSLGYENILKKFSVQIKMKTVFWASLIFQPWVRFENIEVVRMPSWLTYSCLSSFCSYITPAPYRSFCNRWLGTLFQPKLTKHKLIFYLWFSCFQFAILSPNIGNLILERQEYQACFLNPRHYGT